MVLRFQSKRLITALLLLVLVSVFTVAVGNATSGSFSLHISEGNSLRIRGSQSNTTVTFLAVTNDLNASCVLSSSDREGSLTLTPLTSGVVFVSANLGYIRINDVIWTGNYSYTAGVSFNVEWLNSGGPIVIIPTSDSETFYFRSDTYAFNSTFLGYSLDKTNTNYVSTLTDSASGTISYGFRVWVMHMRGNLEELTDGSPDATVTRTVNGAGYQSGYLTISRKDWVLGFDRLVLVAYLSDNGGEWQAKATYISNGILTRELYAATWNFTVYTTLAGSACSFSFGDSTHNSRIEGVGLKTPTPQEIALFYGQSGDFFNMVIFPYTYLVGNIVYSLAFLLVGGVIYLKHKKWEIILILIMLFGGSQGFGLLIPDIAFRALYIIILIIVTIILYKIFR